MTLREIKKNFIIFLFNIYKGEEDRKMSLHVLLQAQGKNIVNIQIRLKTKNYIVRLRNKISINSPQIICFECTSYIQIHE